MTTVSASAAAGIRGTGYRTGDVLNGRTVVWAPQPGPQTALVYEKDADEVFLGGARGGGKTYGSFGEWLVHQQQFGHHAQALFVRRRYRQLEKTIDVARRLFRRAGAEITGNPAVATFPNGAKIWFRHLWDLDDVEDYQGHEYTRIYVEEATNWPSFEPIRRLIRGTLRSPAGVPTKAVLTGNPGGVGHAWVRQRYIEPSRRGYKYIHDPVDDTWRVFIPARLEHNPILLQGDPDYERRLRGSGPEWLVRAWRLGDWDISAGGFFEDVWNEDLAVLPAGWRPPRRWRRLRSFDWGSAAPASLGFWAVSNGVPFTDERGREWFFPKGSAIRFREWYTVDRDAYGNAVPNQGMRYENDYLGTRIAELSLEEGGGFEGCVADPAIFTRSGGNSIYEQIRNAGDRVLPGAVRFNRGQNDREAGWQLLRTMMAASGRKHPEEPGLWVTEDCVDWLRTVPYLPGDERHGDRVDTDAEDHAGDETRYLAMAVGRVRRGPIMVTGY